MVEFELSPLDDIEPWGSAPNLSLHWFGLSDGLYHLELGSTRLLEYSSVKGWPQFVEYQLARIHEDLIEMLPDVVEVVPPSVSDQFRDGSLGATLLHLRSAWESREDVDVNLDAAIEALGGRALDTAYLSPSAGIWIWSSATKTVIEWDNRGRLLNGNPAWTAQNGRHELSRDQFLEEMISFDRRLMETMGSRIRAVTASWTRPEVKIDFKRLAAEHVERGTWLDSAVRHGPRIRDWQAVQEVLSRTQSGRSA